MTRLAGFEDRLQELAAEYYRWTLDEDNVSPDWQRFFADLEPPARRWLAAFNRPRNAETDDNAPPPRTLKDSIRAMLVVRNYRIRGHYKARLDPLGLAGGEEHPDLDLSAYGFEAADMDRPVFLDGVLGFSWATMAELVATLERIYCGSFGAEYMHIQDPVQKHWLQTRIETRAVEALDERNRRTILEGVVSAEEFERFLARRFSGTKRFGLDGAETTVPALDQILQRGSALGVDQVVLGMPHRGRLNILANVMDKPYTAIFHEFSGGSAQPEDIGGSGDVKYHLGTSTDRVFDGRRMHLSLTANPSHLEAVNTVVLGKARAKQRQLGDHDRTRVLPLLLHGDAAFAGQGLVAETMDLSDLKGYKVGGTIHFIVNNQIGFTTNPVNARSGPYCSDVAKGVQAPIFHVNGDDPEAVVQAARLAIEFRQTFHRDVVVDMFCYRRFGHNEIDEPSFTQPRMYKVIGEHKTISEIHAARLEADGILAAGEADDMRARARSTLERAFDAAEGYKANKADWLEGVWSRVKPLDEWGAQRGETGVPSAALARLAETLTTVPEGFHLHPKILKFLAQRRTMYTEGTGIDWSSAEALAFASLVSEGHPLRMSGQDCNRGTFTQRHAALIDQDDERVWKPLAACAQNAESVEIIDSPLSEMGVLGFEYGFALADPDALVVWEAQFGDFANGAQVIVDQFVATAEAKWLRMSALVMLLPHGYEGQGPEHSSARPERFLQLAAGDNLQIVNCTTPANYFHVLRRQLKRENRKPLIVFTPKSLLRDKRCVSDWADFVSETSFHRVMWEQNEEAEKVEQVVLCSGKVYYDLRAALEAMGEHEAAKIALVRVEQLYPWPTDALIEALSPYPNAHLVWCQEESRNMGAWGFALDFLEETAAEAGMKNPRPRYAGRSASASVATGLLSRHRAEQEALVQEALTINLPYVGRVARRRDIDRQAEEEEEANAKGRTKPAGRATPAGRGKPAGKSTRKASPRAGKA